MNLPRRHMFSTLGKQFGLGSEPEVKAKTPVNAPAPRSMGLSANTLLVMKKDVYDFGYEKGRSSQVTEPDPLIMDSLRAQAGSMGRSQGAVVFSPGTSRHDKLRQEQHDEAQERRKDLVSRIEVVGKDIQERRDAASELGPPPKMPEADARIVALGTVLVALTVCGSAHDYLFFGIENEAVAWMLSLLGGLAVGGLLTYALVYTYKVMANSLRSMGLLGGLLIAGALLGVRWAASETAAGWLMGLALAVLEAGVVVMLEAYGRGLRREYAAYVENVREHDRRAELLKSAETGLSRLTDELANCEQVIREFVAHVFDRESRAAQVESLVNDAVEAILAGYRAAIADNRAQMLRGGGR